MSTDKSRDEKAPWPVKCAERKPAAVILIAACAIGAWLVWEHWAGQLWKDRAAELGGPGKFQPLDPDRAGRLLGFAGNWWLPALGLLLLAAGGLLGRTVLAGPQARRISVAAAWTLVALIGLHWIENGLLAATIHAAQANQHTDVLSDHHLNPYALWLQGVTFLGDALLPMAGLVAVIGGATALSRLVAHWFGKPKAKVDNKPRTTEDAGKATTTENAGGKANWIQNMELPPGRSETIARETGRERVGICLSGGGIRSASFTMGALQALQGKESAGSRSELMKAEYLTAVSGGSYTAGAFVLAVQKRGGSNETGGPAEGNERPVDLNYDQVFTPGSPEFDYLRRHSSYIADGLREWAIAVFVMLRGAVLSTLILGSVAMTAGLWVGHLYYRIERPQDLDDPWHPIWGPIFVTICLAGLGLLLWGASAMVILPCKAREPLAEIAKMTWLAVAVLAILGAAIPIATWASMRIIDLTGGLGTSASGLALGAAKGGAIGLLGALTTIVGLLSRQRTRVRSAMRNATGPLQQRLGDTGKRAFEWLCVYSGLAIVAIVYLIIFGYSTHLASSVDPDIHPTVKWGIPSWTLPLSVYQVTYALTGLLIILYLIVDETAMGLHAFYRSRLAKAFAVRRVAVSKKQREEAGQVQSEQQQTQSGDANECYKAKVYEWSEATTLSEYGRSPQPFPQIIFCASAHCSDPEETPPGRHILPFTFSHDYVGGAKIGWCRTEKLCDLRKRLRADLTVQTAMAVSGAAFASATVSYQGAANLILALANARLGTWLPSPSQLKETGEHPDWWWRARPPHIRRMCYLLREIFGWYPKELPLVFVTDGGQYENLGLIELMRHRCTEIYCFDATSDAQTFGDSLAKSISLAANELGVDVVIDEPERADPRTDSEQADGGDLEGRIAQTPIITASLTYPDCGRGSSCDGFLVIGRATMDEGTPWEIRRHAATHPLFPNDATGDQWFDDAKFNAYTGLGRHVGELARQAMRRHQAHHLHAVPGSVLLLTDSSDSSAPELAAEDGANSA